MQEHIVHMCANLQNLFFEKQKQPYYFLLINKCESLKNGKMIYKVAIPFVLFFVCAGGNKSKQRQYPALPQS